MTYSNKAHYSDFVTLISVVPLLIHVLFTLTFTMRLRLLKMVFTLNQNTFNLCLR